MENKILKYQLIDWKSLKPFQPKDLKKQSKDQLNKIKESFKNNGFKSPFLVWEDKDTIWALDGHTRLLAFKLLESDGVDIPKQLPAIFVDCKNKKEAKKAVLIYNSHYADIQQDQLFDFIKDLNLDDLKNEIDITNIKFDIDNMDFSDKNKEIDIDNLIKNGRICPKCGFEFE